MKRTGRHKTGPHTDGGNGVWDSGTLSWIAVNLTEADADAMAEQLDIDKPLHGTDIVEWAFVDERPIDPPQAVEVRRYGMRTRIGYIHAWARRAQPPSPDWWGHVRYRAGVTRDEWICETELRPTSEFS